MGADIDRYQYLALLAACIVITLPLEFVLGARVYRRPRRLVAVLTPVIVLFVLWDVLAAERGHWGFSQRFTTGWALPGGLPVEEVAFFVVVPICALLTYETVSLLWPTSKDASDA